MKRGASKKQQQKKQQQTTLEPDGTVSKKPKMEDYRDLREAPPTSEPRAEDKDAYWKAKEGEKADPPVPVETDETDLESPKALPGTRAVKVVSWNVAGFRSVLKKGFLDYVAKEQPDVLCLQETKIAEKIVSERDLPPGYECTVFYECADAVGRHGTALLSREKPLDVRKGMGIPELDIEGRLITAEFDTFFVVCTYVPNSSDGLVHWAYRRRWDEAFLAYLKELDAKKPVIWCGDLNVAHRWVDVYKPTSFVCCSHNHHHYHVLLSHVSLLLGGTQLNKVPGFLYGERDNFTRVLESGFVDVYEHFYPGARGMYTFWSYRGGGRAKNNGWRLDYFVLSKRALDRVQAVWRRPTVTGSDHCPIGLLFTVDK